MVACKKGKCFKQLKIWMMVGTVLYTGHKKKDLMEWQLSSPILFLSSMPRNFTQPCIPGVNINSLHYTLYIK